MSEQTQLDEFRKMCENHDLTYSYSDDGAAYRRGQAQYDAIMEFAKGIPRADAARIWNEVATKKLRYPVDFLWEV